MKSGSIFLVADEVRKASFSLHRHLRHGHVEKVYENGLAHRLRKLGIHVVQQFPMAVYDEDGTSLGEFNADLLVEGQLLVELKAVRALVTDHVAQLLGYLRSSHVEHGLLINFGSPRLEIQKYVLSRA